MCSRQRVYRGSAFWALGVRGPWHFPSMVRGAAIPESKPRLRPVRHAAPRSRRSRLPPSPSGSHATPGPHTRFPGGYTDSKRHEIARKCPTPTRALPSVTSPATTAIPASATRGDAGVTEAATAGVRRQEARKVPGGVRADRPQRRESSPRDPPQPRNGLLLQ